MVRFVPHHQSSMMAAVESEGQKSTEGRCQWEITHCLWSLFDGIRRRKRSTRSRPYRNVFGYSICFWNYNFDPFAFVERESRVGERPVILVRLFDFLLFCRGIFSVETVSIKGHRTRTNYPREVCRHRISTTN